MDFTIETLGPRTITSPVVLSKISGDFTTNYVDDNLRTLLNPTLAAGTQPDLLEPLGKYFEIAGPREQIYFDPAQTRCAIVTCGGLCPGINDVIRSLVMELWYWYGVREILGVSYGYKGFLPEAGFPLIPLSPDRVDAIHHQGGTFLGSSRGLVKPDRIVDTLTANNISILFTIGGDGTQKGALAIHEIIKKRGLKIGVVGIPKTIDNDVLFMEKSFGFETAFSIAVDVIRGAHVEAKGAYNGIGLVKLMGRDSGFIAASAAIANHDVNFVLVPEVPFDLEGRNGFLNHLEKRLSARHHAVICVAEGAGQNLMASEKREQDASGNVKHADIGLFLCNRIKEHLGEAGMDFALKYMDPSYIIRSAPAIPPDAVYCTELGQNAAHAAMAGKTAMIVGSWNGVFTHVPIRAIITGRKKIDPESGFWLHAVESTGQPFSMVNR